MARKIAHKTAKFEQPSFKSQFFKLLVNSCFYSAESKSPHILL